MARYVIFVLVFFLAAGGIGAQDIKPLEISCADLALSYTPEQGAVVTAFGMIVSKGSSLWVMHEDWSDRYYGAIDKPDLLRTADIEDWKGGKKITLHHHLPEGRKGPFRGTETFTLLPDNSITYQLDFSFSHDLPAVFEWNIAQLNPTLFLGCPYQVKDDKQTTNTITPVLPMPGPIYESMMARAFNTVQFDTRFGPVVIESHASDDLFLLDFRKNKWAQWENPLFWLGVFTRKIVAAQPVSVSVTIRFPKTLTLGGERGFQSRPVEFAEEPGILNPSHDPEYVIPMPKEMKFNGSDMPLGATLLCDVTAAADPEVDKALRFFGRDMESFFNIRVEPRDPAQPLTSPVLRLVLEKDLPGLPAPAAFRSPEHPEGYALRIAKGETLLSARTPRGLFNGLMTLQQLIKINSDGLFFKGAEISDYPALDFRGIHCLSGKNAGDQIAKAVRLLMARFKINTLVWECQYIIWDSQPDLAHLEYGMDKQDARKVVDAAAESFVEIIPLVQSLGHSEWIFTNGRNLDIAEDPEKPYTYNPTNPRTYEFIFSVYQEALDFFKPRTFHIGHDEVTMLGRFPWKSKDSGKTATQLIMEDTLKLKKWFDERGIRVMLWGDMFLWKTEASCAALAPSLADAVERRRLLPRDITVCDWHYESFSPEGYTSLELFKKEGRPVIGAAWYNPENIRNLSQACVKSGAYGFLQTTWAGFNFDIDNLEKEHFQYWAYIWAAHYAWTGTHETIAALPFNAQEVFWDLWFNRKRVTSPRPGVSLDLSPLFNRRLQDDERGSGWTGFGPGYDLSSFSVQETRFGDTMFRIKPGDNNQAALFLAGKINPTGDFPREVRLLLAPRGVAAAHFLMACSARTRNGNKVGAIRFSYDDGTFADKELIYGRNCFATDDVRAGSDARIAWRADAANGLPLRLWDLVFDNPQPEKNVTAVILQSEDTESAPVFMAVSLLDR